MLAQLRSGYAFPMPLTPKQRLGPYAIVEMAGAGGMGEVYRALDTRLDRTVAIKVLPAGTGAAASARFEREARAISQLSHPHICRLFDLGTDEGIEFLVMEYLEGQTLAERIRSGPLSIREVLRYGSEIADALGHAHRRGITHRDLKPGNVMITAEGTKLLDFGLAKLLEPAPPVDSSETLKLPDALTEQGTVVGTTLYMSPEQIEGKPLDHRTDIFSFGIVLYEMLTGARPFEGPSRAAITASILKSDPRPFPVGLAVPAALQHLITTALEKDPERRWQTAHDLALQLRWINGALSGELAATAVAPRRKRAGWLLLPLVLAGGVAMGWMAGLLREPPQEAQLPVHLRMSVAPVSLRSHVEALTFAISPEGRRVVFAGFEKGVPALYLRSLDSAQAHTIAGTEGGASPFWSPDGRWIGFTARGKLWKILADRSGTPIAICDVSVTGTVAAWGDGFILFAERPGGRPEIHRVSEDGGTPSAVTKVQPGEYRHTWPQLVPGSKRFVYLAVAFEKMGRTLFVGRLDAIDPKRLLEETSRARVVGDRVYYVRDGSLVVQRADFAEGRFLDEPRRLADQLARAYWTGSAEFDVAANGTIIYRTQTSTGRLFITDLGGKERRALDDSGVGYGGRFSPDGARVAAGLLMPSDMTPSIWLYDMHRTGRDRLTSERALEVQPVWSPDGRSIVYGQAIGSPPTLVRQLLAGGEIEVLTRSVFQLAGNFSPDGMTLYYTQSPPGRPAEIHKVVLDGTQRSEPVVTSSFDNGDPQLSPDGKWLAFASGSADGSGIYLLPLGGGERIRISEKGGYMPRWSQSGNELYFMGPDMTVIMAKRGASGRWSDATLTTLFKIPNLRRGDSITAFDVSPSGDTFLIGETRAGEGDGDIQVILNADLKTQ